MNIKDELASLSLWVYFWFVTIVLVWALTFIWMWQYPLCCCLFVIPFLLFLVWWYQNRTHCSLNQVLKPFLHGYINITLLAFMLQFVGVVIIIFLFAATQLLTNRPGKLFFIVVCISYYVAVEEALKLFFALKARDSVIDPVNHITKVHTITSTATALGYSMFQGTLWTFYAADQLKIDDDKDGDEYSLFGWLFLITLILAVIGMPMHLITGYVTGCKITQKDIEWAGRDGADAEDDASERNRRPFCAYLPAIYSNILVRAAYLFCLYIGCLFVQFSAMGVIVALLCIVLDYVLLIVHAKAVERSLPFDYLQRAGQLSLFGYNVLPDQPDEEEHFADMQQNEAFDDNDIALDANDNQIVQVTTASMQQFSPAQMDQPMKIGALASPGDIKVHVRPEMLEETNSNSENDNDNEEQDQQQPIVR